MRSILPAIFLVFALMDVHALPEDWDAILESQSKECVFVVIGRVVDVQSSTHSDEKTVSLATLRVKRYLKGASDMQSLDVEFRFESFLDMRPDEEDVVWFIRQKTDNGRYLITDWKWGTDSLYMILEAISRVDKETRIPGMPKPPSTEGPISLALAFDDGEGKAVTTLTTTSLREIHLLVQFENQGKSPHAVMPCLDGSDIHWRYPHYDMEVIDATGNPVDVRCGARCGNINSFKKGDVVLLGSGEVFRTWARRITRRLDPGKYKIRLHYTAKRDLDKKGLPLGDDDPEVQELIGTVWEGTIQSNWIEVEILAEEKDAEK